MIRPTKLGKGGFGGEGFDDDMEVGNICFVFIYLCQQTNTEGIAGQSARFARSRKKQMSLML